MSIKDKIKNMNKSVIYGIVALLILILVGVYTNFNESNSNFVGIFDRFERKEDKGNISLDLDGKINGEFSLEEVTDDGSNPSGQSNSQTASVSQSGLKLFNKVKVAVLADPELFDYKGGKVRGCDVVAMVDTDVFPTPAPLTAAYKKLFEITDEQLGFMPGNYVGRQNDLSFRSVRIENGIAKVELDGKLNPYAGVCDEPRLKSQIEETALQFNTVKAVEIYLNGELVS